MCSAPPVRRISAPRRDPGRVGGPQEVAVVADAVADPPGARRPRPRYTVTASAACPGWIHTGARSVAALQRDLDLVAVAHAEAHGRGGRDQHGVVPGDLGQRLGQLLQPAVVGEAAVVDGRVRRESHFVPARLRRGCRRRRRLRLDRRPSGAGVGAGDHAVVERPAPELLEVLAGGRSAGPSRSSLTRSRPVRSGLAEKSGRRPREASVRRTAAR